MDEGLGAVDESFFSFFVDGESEDFDSLEDVADELDVDFVVEDLRLSFL